jgi:hypothetical protein
MQSKAISSALISAALLVATPALAQNVTGTAKLAAPASTPLTAVVEGVTWTCQGDTCTGTAERRGGLDSLMKECRKVSAAVGPLAGYVSRGRAMSDRNVATCNRLAAENRTDAELAAK